VIALAPRPGHLTSEPEYSNVDYNLIGLVDARAAGMPAATALRRQVLAPLGLREIAYAAEAPVPGPVATGFVYPRGLGDPRPGTDGGHRITAVEAVMGSAGALYGSPEALARFGHLLFGGRLLEPASLREMARIQPFSGPWDGYGLGVAHRVLDGHEILGARRRRFRHARRALAPPPREADARRALDDDSIKDADLPRALLRAALSERR
jgi:CubicO group peptidase (beta-lactamase class C family)